MGRIGLTEIVLIGVVVLLLFGTKRLPEIGRAIGRALREFKKAGEELRHEINETEDDKPDSRK